MTTRAGKDRDGPGCTAAVGIGGYAMRRTGVPDSPDSLTMPWYAWYFIHEITDVMT